MIALLQGGTHFIGFSDNINDFLIEYVEYIGLDIKIFKAMIKSNDFTLDELIEYINKESYHYDNEIIGICKLGEKIY